MPGSITRFLISVGFNVAVAVTFRFFGATLSTCWFTFLALTLLAALAEMGQHLQVIDSKLDAILEGQQTHKASN